MTARTRASIARTRASITGRYHGAINRHRGIGREVAVQCPRCKSAAHAAPGHNLLAMDLFANRQSERYHREGINLSLSTPGLAAPRPV